MNVIIPVLLAMWIATIPVAEAGEPRKESELRNELRELKQNYAGLRDSLEAIRRDQINYRIERDLLKDAFSSNLQTINLVLTIVLGVFAVLGYLGFKGIVSIRGDYSNELNELRKLKVSLEAEIKTVVAEQATVKDDLNKVIVENQKQDQRLKVLEIKEKVSQLIEAKKYGFALEFAEAGLAIEPMNIQLLNNKATCLMKYARFDQAIETIDEVLRQEPENRVAVHNKHELLLIQERVADFDALLGKHKENTEKERNGGILAYLLAVRALVTKDLNAMKVALTPFLEKCADGTATRLGTWGFDEIRWYMRKAPNSPSKDLMNKAIEFLDGKLSTQDMKALLK